MKIWCTSVKEFDVHRYAFHLKSGFKKLLCSQMLVFTLILDSRKYCVHEFFLYADFCFKKIMVKNNLFSKSIAENWKMEKITMLEKLCLVSFFKFHKKNWIPQKSLHQKNRPKNMHFLMQRFLFHSKFCNQTWKINKTFLYFYYNLQRYSLFYSLFLYGVWQRFSHD